MKVNYLVQRTSVIANRYIQSGLWGCLFVRVGLFEARMSVRISACRHITVVRDFHDQ